MERRWDPHSCVGCGASFEVGYDEELDDSPAAMVEVNCPGCGRVKAVYVPEGAAADLAVELGAEEPEDGVGD